jgi:hypothetical protein
MTAKTTSSSFDELKKKAEVYSRFKITPSLSKLYRHIVSRQNIFPNNVKVLRSFLKSYGFDVLNVSQDRDKDIFIDLSVLIPSCD